jgi:hypothetical protein
MQEVFMILFELVLYTFSTVFNKVMKIVSIFVENK